MPVSDRYQAIFVHIPKCGGSSVEKALGVFGARNDGDLAPAPKILFGVERRRALQHLTLREIRARLPKVTFDAYFKFSFVRNPFDRLVSEYHWRISERMIDASMSFKEFVRREVVPFKPTGGIARWLDDRRRVVLEDHFLPQHVFVCDEAGRIAVDRLGRMESFEKDFKDICLALKVEARLPAVNRTAHRPYREHYDDQTRGWAERVYEKDLEIFHYAF